VAPRSKQAKMAAAGTPETSTNPSIIETEVNKLFSR